MCLKMCLINSNVTMNAMIFHFCQHLVGYRFYLLETCRPLPVLLAHSVKFALNPITRGIFAFSVYDKTPKDCFMSFRRHLVTWDPSEYDFQCAISSAIGAAVVSPFRRFFFTFTRFPYDQMTSEWHGMITSFSNTDEAKIPCVNSI